VLVNNEMYMMTSLIMICRSSLSEVYAELQIDTLVYCVSDPSHRTYVKGNTPTYNTSVTYCVKTKIFCPSPFVACLNLDLPPLLTSQFL